MEAGRTLRGRRSRTLSRKEIARAFRLERESGVVDLDVQRALVELEKIRPRRREDCLVREGPCPFCSCRWHLYLDVDPRTGSIKFNFPDREVWELDETCVLNIAERGGVTLEEVGKFMNITRERVRQLETRALLKLKAFADGPEDASA